MDTERTSGNVISPIIRTRTSYRHANSYISIYTSYRHSYILLFLGIHMQVTKLFHCIKIRNTNSINAILTTLLVQKFWKMKQRTCSGIAVFVAKKGNSMDNIGKGGNICNVPFLQTTGPPKIFVYLCQTYVE